MKETYKPLLVVFTGAGMSAESGIRTFRDMGGLWEQYDISEVATPEAWGKNPGLVLKFYNERRKQLLDCKPNIAHIKLAELEKEFEVKIITQNVDDFHERAGSTNILHLHGELRKVRSTGNPDLIYQLDGWELKLGDKCEQGHQLRPHIVWFGENVTNMGKATEITSQADIFVIIGTSLNVYPAAGLINYTRPNIPVFLIDPNPVKFSGNFNIRIISEKATKGIDLFIDQLKTFL